MRNRLDLEGGRARDGIFVVAEDCKQMVNQLECTPRGIQVKLCFLSVHFAAFRKS